MTPETTSTAKSRLFDPPLNKDFRAYFIGQSISSFGDGIVSVTFAFAALAVSPDGTGMPAVLLGLWISRMAFIGLGGHAGQRVNRALVMLIADADADAVRLIAQLCVALVFTFGEPAIWHLVLSAVIYGIGTAFFVPSSVGLLPRLISRGELQQANSLLGIVSNSAFLIGSALAALLVLAGGVQTALQVDAGTFLISMTALTTILRGAHSLPDGWRDPALEAAESATLADAPESQFALTDAYLGLVGRPATDPPLPNRVLGSCALLLRESRDRGHHRAWTRNSAGESRRHRPLGDSGDRDGRGRPHRELPRWNHAGATACRRDPYTAGGARAA
jgi:hypothetical protein